MEWLIIAGVGAVVLLVATQGAIASAANYESGQSGPVGVELSPFMRYIASDISVFARNAGFTGADLVKAIAIALAESQGDPAAYNPETAAATPAGEGSYGLWQIYRKAHPEFTGIDLFNPQENAHAAFSIYRGAGFSFRPWSTYKSGVYLARLPEAQEGVTLA